jgi:hypothetical protein
MKDVPYVALWLFLISFSLSPIAVVHAADSNPQPEASTKNLATVTLTGTVTDIQGEKYIIKDSYGIKWEFLVDRSTDQSGQVMPGVLITAEVDTKGHAKKVKLLGKG